MKKINGHDVVLDTTKASEAPGKSSGSATSLPASKGPFSPYPPKDIKPPLRAAKGDDDLMSEEPSVPERG
jgi:hypothetical protein